MSLRYVFSAAVCIALATPTGAQGVPTDLSISVDWTVQQKEDGKLSRGYHVLQLTCGRGACELVAVTLNQCIGSGEYKSFFPKVERATTRDGSLRVTRTAKDVLLVEMPIQGGQITHRLTLVRDTLGMLRVGMYSGGFMKDSPILRKVINVEYVPLIGADVLREMDCPAALPGVGTN